MKTSTKIIATLGPISSSEEILKELILAGVNVFRFNFSHANYEDTKIILERIRKLEKELNIFVGKLLDTKGPEIRTGNLDKKIKVSKGEEIFISTKENFQNSERQTIFCDYEFLGEDLNIGDRIIIDSGLLIGMVTGKNENGVFAVMSNDFEIGSRRHINLPGISLKLPGISEKDRSDIIFAAENNFDFIAHSFVRNAETIREIKNILSEKSGENIKIISKIENNQGLQNLEEIVLESDGIMVARGDLGIEEPFYNIPVYQTEILNLCHKYGKICIVATEMLESMIKNPSPTRAEVSDIYNATLNFPDSLMLSGETAGGNFPIESINVMKKTIYSAEKHRKALFVDFEEVGLSKRDIEKKHLISAGLNLVSRLGYKALIILTKTGRLSRLASSARTNINIFAFTPSEATLGNSALFGSVRTFQNSAWTSENYSSNMETSLNILFETKKLKIEDTVVVINDIQKDSKEFPILEIVNLKDYFEKN